MGLLVAVIAVLLIIYLATVSPGFRIVLLVVLAAALPLAYLWYLQSEKQSADNESRLTIARSLVKPTDLEMTEFQTVSAVLSGTDLVEHLWGHQEQLKL